MSAERPGAWPLSHQEFEQWVNSVPWQDAVTAVSNPHSYHLKRRTPSPRTFERMVLHLREFGYQWWVSGQEYSNYEASGFRFWTMQLPLEHTVLINRKPLSGVSQADTPKEALEDMTLPELFTSRYLAGDVLSSGLVVPVRISMYPPEPLLEPLPYELSHEVRDLMPLRSMHAKWHTFSTTFWRHLDAVGVSKIAAQLATISAQHDGRALALCCFEDLPKGQRCHRVIVATWWYEQTGQKMLELTNEGEALPLEKLHPQVMPIRSR